MTEATEQHLPLVRPTAEEAAGRMVILTALFARALRFIRFRQEHPSGELPSPTDHKKTLQYLIDNGLESAIAERERRFIEVPFEEVTEPELNDSLWGLESAAVLYWALQKTDEQPSFIERVPQSHFTGLPADIMSLVSSARLRNEQEIDRYRNQTELWLWRSRTQDLMINAYIAVKFPIGPFNSFEEIIGATVEGAVVNGELAPDEVIEKDFAVNGKAFPELTEEERYDVARISYQRLLAANWLCGYAPDKSWDKTPTAT